MMLILCYGFDSRDNLFGKLNQYNEFALKYMSLSMVLAVAEPFAERFVRKKVAVTVKSSLVLGLTTAPAAAWLPPALPEFPGFPVPGFPVPSGLAASFHPTEIGDNPYTLNRIPSAVFSTAGYSASQNQCGQK